MRRFLWKQVLAPQAPVLFAAKNGSGRRDNGFGYRDVNPAVSALDHWFGISGSSVVVCFGTKDIFGLRRVLAAH